MGWPYSAALTRIAEAAMVIIQEIMVLVRTSDIVFLGDGHKEAGGKGLGEYANIGILKSP